MKSPEVRNGLATWLAGISTVLLVAIGGMLQGLYANSLRDEQRWDQQMLFNSQITASIKELTKANDDSQYWRGQITQMLQERGQK